MLCLGGFIKKCFSLEDFKRSFSSLVYVLFKDSKNNRFEFQCTNRTNYCFIYLQDEKIAPEENRTIPTDVVVVINNSVNGRPKCFPAGHNEMDLLTDKNETCI